MELDEYWSAFSTVLSMELYIFWPVQHSVCYKLACICYCSPHGASYILASIINCSRSQNGASYILTSIVHCSQHGARYLPASLPTVPSMELDIYLPVLATVPSMELDIYRTVLSTVPRMELAIYWTVLSTVPGMELDIY